MTAPPLDLFAPLTGRASGNEAAYEPSPTTAEPQKTTTRVRIRHVRYISTGQLWSATDDDTGELLVAESKDPEFAAARVLAARGITGTLETFTGERQFASFRQPVEKMAKLAVLENEREGPRVVRYRPFLGVGKGASEG